MTFICYANSYEYNAQMTTECEYSTDRAAPADQAVSSRVAYNKRPGDGAFSCHRASPISAYVMDRNMRLQDLDIAITTGYSFILGVIAWTIGVINSATSMYSQFENLDIVMS